METKVHLHLLSHLMFFIYQVIYTRRSISNIILPIVLHIKTSEGRTSIIFRPLISKLSHPLQMDQVMLSRTKLLQNSILSPSQIKAHKHPVPYHFHAHLALLLASFPQSTINACPNCHLQPHSLTHRERKRNRMAGQTTTATTLFLLMSMILMIILLLDFSYVCHADPDPVDDICIADLSTGQRFANGYPCKPASQVTADDLVSDVLAKEGNTSNVFGSFTTHGTVVKFPGLNTMGMSMNRVDFAPGGINAPHTHPRASELVIVVRGTLFIGIITADNKYFSKVVKKGEMFIVPRGLMHFQCNIGKGKAQTYAAFNSQLPGGISVPKSLFRSTPSIPDGLLSKVFQLDEATVRASKAKLVNI